MTDRLTLWLRRIARALSVILIIIATLILVTHIIWPDTEPGTYPPIENLLPVIMYLGIISLALGWRWEGLAALLNIGLFLVELALYWAINGYFFPFRAVPLLAVVVVPGILFLICWFRDPAPTT